MSLIDIIICIGPKDAKNSRLLVNSIKENIININKIYVIMPTNVLELYRLYDPIVINIDENIFPFHKEYIDKLFNCPDRSGWYLQQLLKIYAPIVISEVLDNYIIIDGDLKFYSKVSFFENNKVLFNTDIIKWQPYMDHMNRLYSDIETNIEYSGVTHLMPMKRHIVEKLIMMVEEKHKMEFWKVFLGVVDSKYYDGSGASEYEILFHFTLQYFPDECKIRPIRFKSSNTFTYSLGLVYESYLIK